jgi:hypothetical protein
MYVKANTLIAGNEIVAGGTVLKLTVVDKSNPAEIWVEWNQHACDGNIYRTRALLAPTEEVYKMVRK